MWYKRKTFVIIICIAVLVGCCVCISAFGSLDSVGEIIIDESCGPESYPLNNNPDILYEDNSELLISPHGEDGDHNGMISLEDVVNVAELEAVGGKIMRSEYVTYAEFVNEISANDGKTPQIHDNRVVFVVEIYYPSGLDVRAGHIENCMALALYDAETGEYLGGEYRTVSEG